MTAFVTTESDLAIQNNNLALTTNDSDQEIEQRIRQNLLTYLGEWFLDITIGIPYLQLVYQKGVPAIMIEAAFKDVITNTPWVAALTQFDPIDLDSATRRLTVNFSVRTINNTITAIGFTA